MPHPPAAGAGILDLSEKRQDRAHRWIGRYLTTRCLHHQVCQYNPISAFKKLDQKKRRKALFVDFKP